MIRHRFATFTFAISFGFVAAGFAADGGLAKLKAAQEKSTQTGKPLLLVCGAEWCGPCKTLEKWMETDAQVKPAAANYIYHHIDVDKEKDAYQSWLKKYKAPGNGIPMIFIVKSDGDLLHSQCGITAQKGMAELFNKFAKAVGKATAAITPKVIGSMKTAAKEAEALLEEGKLISAYEKFAEFSEEIKSDNKALTKVKGTFKKIEEAAIAKIASAKELVETAKSESKRFDGAFQLTVIAGSMSDCEAVASKVTATVDKLKDDAKYKDLFKQADMFYSAREAAKEEDTAKAKKLYEKIVADFKNSEAAKRAKAKLEELEGGS